MLTVTEGQTHDWANMPLKEMAFGNAMDCDFTLRSWNILKKDMSSLGLVPVYQNLLKKITEILGEVEYTGINVDVDYLSLLEEKLEAELETLKDKLIKLSPLGGDFNPNSTPQVGKVLFSASGFGLVATKLSAKTNAPSITEEHLTELLENATTDKPKEFIKTLMEYKTKTKQYKTYVIGVKDALAWNGDGRIYSSYNFAATVTGRLSCSKYSAGKKKGMSKGVSFHTLPRPTEDVVNIRKLMISDEEKVFIAADFSTAELRVLAQCCKDPALISAFQSGQDLHNYTASLIYGKDVNDITKAERQVAKSVSFLIVYGGGPSKLSQQIGKSIGYCKNIFAAYQNSFPKVFEWIQYVHKYIRQNKCATSLFGRRRNLSNVASPIKKYQFRALRQGMNFVIQSSASDLMLHAIKRLNIKLLEKGYDAQILATVHDSVEIQCVKSQMKDVVELVKKELTNTEDLQKYYNLNVSVPFEVDIEVGNSFGDGLEVEFSKEGEFLNHDEILRYVESS
jgi:DNA polymerase-1